MHRRELVFINLVFYIGILNKQNFYDTCELLLPPRTSHFTFNAALIVCGAVRLFITVPFILQKIGIDGNSKKQIYFLPILINIYVLRMLFVNSNNKNKQFLFFLHFDITTLRFGGCSLQNSLVPIKDSLTLTFLVGPLKKSTLQRYAAASSNLT